jgi:hypothetical protein
VKLELTDDAVEFHTETGLAGVYRLDPAKPFLHPLKTAAGHVVSAATPHDHLHHKGMMFSLQTAEVTWWDEAPHPDSLHVGRQRHERFVDSAHDGFTQALVWEAVDGSCASFAETRRISCREVPGGFEWRWESRLRALRNLTLTQAAHSLQRADGSRVNYQGLSLRLTRDFALGSRLLVEDERVPFVEASGLAPQRVRLEGRLDPHYPAWPGPPVAIEIESDQGHGLFALNQPFPYLALGPSNLAPLSVTGGDVLVAQYLVTVVDLTAE